MGKFPKIGNALTLEGKLENLAREIEKKPIQIEKLEKLVTKISYDYRGDEAKNAARNLVKILEKAYKEGKLDIDSLKNSRNLVIKGIAQTLEYLDGKIKEFDETYGGWGLYKPVTEGVHSGEHALMFAKIGGNAKVIGEWAGEEAEFYGNSEAAGDFAGCRAKFYGKSKATGLHAGGGAKFYGNSEAVGKYAGENAEFYGNSKASGKFAGEGAKFYGNSEASGEHAGSYAEFYHNSKATGECAGWCAQFYNDWKSNRKYLGEKAKIRTSIQNKNISTISKIIRIVDTIWKTFK